MAKAKTQYGRTAYPHYLFKDHDPVIDQIATLIEGRKLSYVATASGVSAGTLANWMKRKTKRPQYASIAAVVNAMGGTIEIVLLEKGKAKAPAPRRPRLRVVA